MNLSPYKRDNKCHGFAINGKMMGMPCDKDPRLYIGLVGFCENHFDTASIGFDMGHIAGCPGPFGFKCFCGKDNEASSKLSTIKRG